MKRIALRLLPPPLLLAIVLTSSAQADAPDLHLEDYRGKVVYIDFWASWCGPCRESFPWLQAMYREYHDDGLIILAVDVDQDRQAAEQFLAEFSPAFAVIFDPTGALPSRFDVMGMPSSYMLDRNGEPRFKHIGFHEDMRTEYEQHIRTLLAEQGTNTAERP